MSREMRVFVLIIKLLVVISGDGPTESRKKDFNFFREVVRQLTYFQRASYFLMWNLVGALFSASYIGSNMESLRNY